MLEIYMEPQCSEAIFAKGCCNMLQHIPSIGSERKERLRDLLVDGTDLSVAEDRHQATPDNADKK